MWGRVGTSLKKAETAEHFSADGKDLVKKDWLTMQLTEGVPNGTDP